MLIRYGYDFTLDCPQPTPMVCLVSARPEHDAALAAPELHRTLPQVEGHFYLDSFGNRCLRLPPRPGGCTCRAAALSAPMTGPIIVPKP